MQRNSREGELIVQCEGFPTCDHCTEQAPGPVGIPVVTGNAPGQQLLAEMVAHMGPREASRPQPAP